MSAMSLPGLLPRTYFLRVFWTLATGLAGVVYYKVSQASEWASERVNLALLAVVSTAMGIFDSASLIKEAFGGWENLSLMLPARKTPGPSGNGGQPQASTAVALASDEPNDAAPRAEKPQEEDLAEFRHFIRRMIEVRTILRAANMEHKFDLPRIVVVGSQSSGKSSVLESIVGHEFLPKGQNMVTRRPLELTLINDPNAESDYAIIGDPSGPKIFDFSQVEKALTDLNLGVPESGWISDSAIQLTIHGRQVPDLTLIDLPGYIQLSSRNQPSVLREKIVDLCQTYIEQPNNIILAVCPADVDLANAEALKASRRVDPKGERTIGVVTKLDLVDPSYGAELLHSGDYPLQLGYIGVVCKPLGLAQSKARFLQMIQERKTQEDEVQSRAAYETGYFNLHSTAYKTSKGQVGVRSLRDKLIAVLEDRLGRCLAGVLRDVQEELANVRYQLKVEFNDRSVSPEGYTSQLLGAFKGSLDQTSHRFTRSHVKDGLKGLLEDHLMRVIEQHLLSAPVEGESLLVERLQKSIAALTRSGIGKATSQALVDQILADLGKVLQGGPLASHPVLRGNLLAELEAKLRLHSIVAADMVENALKPLKHDLEYTEEEWKTAKQRLLELLESRIATTADQLARIQQEVGAKRLRRIIQAIAQTDSEPDPPVSKSLLDRAQEAVRLNHRARMLKRRLGFLESSGLCDHPARASWLAWLSPWRGREAQEHDELGQPLTRPSACHQNCPEVYLYLLFERLLKTSSLFVHHELIQEFLGALPNDLSSSSVGLCAADRRLLAETDDGGEQQLLEGQVSRGLVLGTVDRDLAMGFVAENPTVARHVDLLARRKALERVRDRLLYLKQRKEEADTPFAA